MVMVTRAQAKQQLEELIRREQEVLSGEQPSPVEGLGQSSGETSYTNASQEGQVPLILFEEQMGKQDSSTGEESVADTLDLPYFLEIPPPLKS